MFTDNNGTGLMVDVSTGMPLYFNTLADNTWHHMSGDLSNYAGETVSYLIAGLHSTMPAGTNDIWIANVAVLRADGSVLPVFTGQSVGVPYYSGRASGAYNLLAETEMTATDSGISTNFFVDDHLGTVQLEFSSIGGPVWQGEFAPFGQELSGQLTTNTYKFTGKERDAESGLDYMDARYYGSSMGRFMSPDPLGGHLEDPQTLNRYAYARNNPLTFSDPTGLDFAITCTQTKDNSSTCQSQTVGYDKKGNAQTAFVQGVTGKDGFKMTQVGDDGNGGLVDRTTGTGAYTASVSGSGVSFSQDGGKSSSGGVFVNGTDPTHIQGSGDLSGFGFTFTNSKLEGGQTAAGTFSYSGTLDQARSSLANAGFAYWPGGTNFGYDEFRSRGQGATGANAGHFNLDRDLWGYITGHPKSTVPQGNMHFGEHNPMFSPLTHAHEAAQ